MSGPSVTSHPFPKKRFQAAVVAAIDQHAGAIYQIGERVEAQGGVLADLAVARDALQQQLATLGSRVELYHGDFRGRSFWMRLRWLVLGR